MFQIVVGIAAFVAVTLPPLIQSVSKTRFILAHRTPDKCFHLSDGQTEEFWEQDGALNTVHNFVCTFGRNLAQIKLIRQVKNVKHISLVEILAQFLHTNIFQIAEVGNGTADGKILPDVLVSDGVFVNISGTQVFLHGFLALRVNGEVRADGSHVRRSVHILVFHVAAVVVVNYIVVVVADLLSLQHHDDVLFTAI